MKAVHVNPHRREQRSGVKREADKAWSDFESGSRDLGRDFKSGWKREFGRRPHKYYYVRGVKDDKAAGEIFQAKGPTDARAQYRDMHPEHKIILVHKKG